MKIIDFSNVTVTVIDKNKPGIVFPKGVRPDNLYIVSKEQSKYKYSRLKISRLITYYENKDKIPVKTAYVLRRALLDKSTTKNHIPGVGKKVTRPKPNKIEEIEVRALGGDVEFDVISFSKINKCIQVINYLLEKEK